MRADSSRYPSRRRHLRSGSICVEHPRRIGCCCIRPLPDRRRRRICRCLSSLAECQAPAARPALGSIHRYDSRSRPRSNRAYRPGGRCNLSRRIETNPAKPPRYAHPHPGRGCTGRRPGPDHPLRSRCPGSKDNHQLIPANHLCFTAEGLCPCCPPRRPGTARPD